jgi:hypothetical protein
MAGLPEGTNPRAFSPTTFFLTWRYWPGFFPFLALFCRSTSRRYGNRCQLRASLRVAGSAVIGYPAPLAQTPRCPLRWSRPSFPFRYKVRSRSPYNRDGIQSGIGCARWSRVSATPELRWADTSPGRSRAQRRCRTAEDPIGNGNSKGGKTAVTCSPRHQAACRPTHQLLRRRECGEGSSF